MALVDAGEPDHERCRQALKQLEPPMITTWPVVTEAMYLLGDAAGWNAQRALWQMIERNALELSELQAIDVARVRVLMEKYRDTRMGIVDATLVAVAESRGLKRVFTLDSDFRAYRYCNRESFEIIPAVHRQ